MIILDTNVLSQTLRPTPSTSVLEWMRSEPASALFTTAITESELLYGIALLAEGGAAAVPGDDSRPDFRRGSGGAGIALRHRRSSRVRRHCREQASRRAADFGSRQRIAAITRSRGAALAPRNVGDFAGCRLELIDPWI